MSRKKVIAAVAGGGALVLLVIAAGVGATALMLFGGASSGLGGNECGYDPGQPWSAAPVLGTPPRAGTAGTPAPTGPQVGTERTATPTTPRAGTAGTGTASGPRAYAAGSPAPAESAGRTPPRVPARTGVPAGTGLPAGTALPAAVGAWAGEQVTNAATVVAVGRELDIPPRGWVVAVAAAMQESGLRNLAGGDRDSVGLLQQRPSQGWGTPDELRSPEYQARQFYRKLLTVPGWQGMRLTDAVQAVQRSATPEAYQRWETEAEAVVAGVAGVATIDLLGGGYPGAPCGIAQLAAVIPAGTWEAPVRAAIGSGFRAPSRPHHDGVDFLAPRYTPVRAVSNGVVITVACNSSSGTCDRDGGLDVRGCGWYVEVLHPDDVVTRYCHLVRQPEVTVGETVPGGQVLGFVGSSGNSSGPHLHFEVHKGSVATSADAVDPVPFLRQVGVPLEAPAA